MTHDLKATIERMRERAGYGWREFAISSADALLLLTALDQAAEALEPVVAEAERLRKVHWAHPEPDDFHVRPALSWGAMRQAATVYATLKPADTKEGEG